MKFDPNQSEVFTTDGTTFEFNHERVEYLANHILEHVKSHMNQMGKNYKRAKKKGKGKSAALDILALHSEWYVNDNDETVYLLFNDDDECFTEVTTENEYYSNLIDTQK
jgi:hypothetical protein